MTTVAEISFVAVRGKGVSPRARRHFVATDKGRNDRPLIAPTHARQARHPVLIITSMVACT